MNLQRIAVIALTALASVSAHAETASTQTTTGVNQKSMAQPPVAKKPKAKKPRDTMSTTQAAPIYSTGTSTSTTSKFDSSRIQLRPQMGFSFISPKEANSAMATTLQALGAKSTYELGTAMTFSASADYFFTRNFAAGMRLDYFSTSTESVTVETGGGKANLQSSLTGLPLYATLSGHLPIESTPVTLGGFGGMGIPMIYKVRHEVTGSTINGLPNGGMEYTANPMTWILGVSGEYDFSSTIGMRLDLMYRRLSSDQMKHSGTYANIKDGELWQDQNNTNVKVNASSMVSMLGMTIRL